MKQETAETFLVIAIVVVMVILCGIGVFIAYQLNMEIEVTPCESEDYRFC